MVDCKKLIIRLSRIINEGGGSETINTLEDILSDEIRETIKEESFYCLPINNIVSIIKQGCIDDASTVAYIASQLNLKKEKEAIQFLDSFDPSCFSFDECIDIIGKLTSYPIFKRIDELDKINKSLPDKDYEFEIKKLTEKIETMQKDPELLLKFEPVTTKPVSFISNIHEAARQGRIESIQYLIEQEHENPNKKGNNGLTPLHKAALNGQLKVIRYLIEKCHCHADVVDENNHTPLHLAAYGGHLNVVTYLCNECHANVDALSAVCRTPLMFASQNGHIDVVKFLIGKSDANANLFDNYHNNALDYAVKNGNTMVSNYIKDCNH